MNKELKEIKEVYNYEDVNKHLSQGWSLLAHQPSPSAELKTDGGNVTTNLIYIMGKFLDLTKEK